MNTRNRYRRILEKIFTSHYRPGATEVSFKRTEIEAAAKKLRIALPKNLGDLIYSFRYRASLPDFVQRRAPRGKPWMIRSVGRSRYTFVAVSEVEIIPNSLLAETKVADATPGIVAKYAMSDEQSLLAKIRYNRLIDIFTGVTCYSLQSHLRTSVPNIGQIETDELYVGVDHNGVHYIFPVQAKGGKDRLSVVQFEQDYALCISRFRHLVCKPVAAQFLENDLIVLFALEQHAEGLRIASEKHYRLVPPEEISPEELEAYKLR